MTAEFFLGVDDVGWLWDNPPAHNLFISHRRLSKYKTLKRAHARWALDSGGFTELNLHGRWTVPPESYVDAIHRYDDEVGQLAWAAPQDWMCEPQVLAKTGKTVTTHQALTIENFLTLRQLAPNLPIIPVLQGWEPDDYLAHVDMYARCGVDLFAEPLVGMGTFCRRANLEPVHDLVRELNAAGLRMHGFGVKKDGLPILGHYLESADSMAWSYRARRAGDRLCGTMHRAKGCNHCRTWAGIWGDKVVASIASHADQLKLEVAA